MDFIIRLAEEFFKKHKRLARYRRIFAFLAAVVVFATTYELILPAITMDRQRAVQSPGVEVGVAEDRLKGIDFLDDGSLSVDMTGEEAFEAGLSGEEEYFDEDPGIVDEGYSDDSAFEGTDQGSDGIQPGDPAVGDVSQNAEEIAPGADNAGDDLSGAEDSGALTDENESGTGPADDAGTSGEEIADGDSSEAGTGVSGAENGEAG